MDAEQSQRGFAAMGELSSRRIFVRHFLGARHVTICVTGVICPLYFSFYCMTIYCLLHPPWPFTFIS